MTEPLRKRVRSIDVNAIGWKDVEFIRSLGSGSYGCTFEVLYNGEAYAVKVEQLMEQTMDSKEVEISRMVSEDSENPFKLHLYGSYRYKGVLKEGIQIKMHEKCHELWDEWNKEDFRGTWQLTMMELAPVNESRAIVKYIIENMEKAVFSLLYAVTRMHSLGIVHHDIRLANLVLKYATEPVIIDIKGQKYLIANQYEPILAVIDYGLATLNEFKSEYYDGFSHWYGPSPVKRLLEKVRRGDNADHITQTSAVDIWMIAILVLGLNPKFAKKYVNANVSRTFDLDGTVLARLYGNRDLVYLVHMAFLSKQFDASGIDLAILASIQSKTNPYEYLEEVFEDFPVLKSMIQSLLSWDEGQKLYFLNTFAYFTDPLFESLKYIEPVNAAICDVCGIEAAILQCLECNNSVYCSEECHSRK